MRLLTILVLMLTFISTAHSRPTDFGPEKNDARLEEAARLEAVRLAKEKLAREQADAFEARTIKTERDIQRQAILRLAEASAKARKDAKTNFNNSELAAKDNDFYKLNIQQKNNSYAVAFNQNSDINVGRVSRLNDSLNDKIATLLLSLYSNESIAQRDNLIQKLK